MTLCVVLSSPFFCTTAFIQLVQQEAYRRWMLLIYSMLANFGVEKHVDVPDGD